MPTPTVYASDLLFAGVASETIQGTAVAPAMTLICNKIPECEDVVEYLEDMGTRHAMAEPYAAVPGPRSSTVALDGEVRPDTIGYLLNNILGDLTTTGASSPYVNAWSLLNTPPALPKSLTVTRWNGITASTLARAYPGVMLSDLSFDIVPNKLFDFSAKGTGWGSAAAASQPTASPATTLPLAGWTAAIGVGGPASGGTLMSNILQASVQLQRKVKVYPAVGAQQPYIIKPGKFTVSGKITFLAIDETPLTNYLTNVQPQLQFLLNGGTTNIVQLDIQQPYYKVSKSNTSSEGVEFDVDFIGIGNTTNVGASGGFSPIKVTVTSSVNGATQY